MHEFAGMLPEANINDTRSHHSAAPSVLEAPQLHPKLTRMLPHV